MNNHQITTALQKYIYAFGIWTDKADFVLDKSVNIDEDRLLELRCFDESGEYRAVRATPDVSFSEREITDDGSYRDGQQDEAQYLDIDTARTKKEADGWVYATGGGRYHLPEEAKMILVRNYYRYDEEGIARKYDWRLMKYTDQETVGKEER